MNTRTIAAAAAAVGLAIGAFADDVECTWNAGTIPWPADGWTNDSYWKPSAPGEGDTAMFTVAVTAVVDSANAALVGSMKLLSAKSQYDSVVEVDAASDMSLGCMFGGNLKVVKKGGGELSLTSDRRASAIYGYYVDLAAYSMEVKAGRVTTPSTAAALCLPTYLSVAAGAEFWLAGGGNYLVTRGLLGEGLVTNTTSTTRNLQIGTSGSSTYAEFGGKLSGKISVNVCSQQMFTGTQNSHSGAVAVMYGNGDAASNGVFGFAKLGLYDDAESSVGGANYVDSQFGGRLLYLGRGETASKQVLLRTQDSRSPILDGGANGGLVLSGEVRLHSDVAAYNKMAEVVLDGSNAVPCVIAGQYNVDRTSASSEPVTAYTTKKGSGVWRFSGSKSGVSGGFGVDEGTLQFDSIANAGTACSLGKATLLAECYYGDWDALRTAPYAYRLGAEGSTNAVFEFVGSSSCSVADRPAVLGGDAHLKASGATGAALGFTGVSALASGAATKTLVIDGTNTDDNVLADVSDGDGHLSVVKDGVGSWTLAGNLTFTGDLDVRRGVLTVEKKNNNYTWFRVTVKCVSDTTKIRMRLCEVGFYDEDGRNAASGLEFVPGTVETVSGSDYTTRHNPSALTPGQFTLANTTAARYLLKPNYGYANMFDGTTADAWFAGTWNKVPDGVNSGYDFGFVARLDTQKPIVAFDISQCAGEAYPTHVIVEASTDGSTWAEVYNNASTPMTGKNADKWYSDGAALSTATPRLVEGGAGLALRASGIAAAASVLESVASYSVSVGATLRFSGSDAPAISRLVIDGATGAGSISGFKFAANVAVDIRNLPRNAVSIPVDFSGVEGLGDVENWTFTMDGQSPRRRRFRLSATAIDVFRDGLSVMVR